VVVGFRLPSSRNKAAEQQMFNHLNEYTNKCLADLREPNELYELDVESLRVSLLMTDSTLKERVDVNGR
jgi:hypothetical protein